MSRCRLGNGPAAMAVVAVAGVCTAALGPSSSAAAVYNLRLTTDNGPDFTDIRSLVQSVVAKCRSPEEQCIAIWSMARNSRRQASAQTESGRTLWDPILQYNSYGALNCGIVSSLNVSCWRQLGFQTRYVQLGDHTVSEVSWDDGKTWHMFDSSMSFFCYNHEGQIASCAEIQKSHACELSGGKHEPGHYYLYHGAPQCVTHLGADGWRKAGDGPVEFERTLKNGADSYIDGFDVQGETHVRFGQRYSLGLLPGQTYTRYWQPLDTVPAYAGVYRADECYRPAGQTDPSDRNAFGNIRGNGIWNFEPDLADPACRELFYDDEGVELRGKGDVGPRLRPARVGNVASVVFKVAAANVITSLRIHGEALRGADADRLRVLVSANAGITWQQVWASSDVGPHQIEVRLRDEVAGVTECLVKFEMMAAENRLDVGLESLKITTVTQVNRRTLPRLTLGSNRVRLAMDKQAETMTHWPWLAAGDPRPSTYEEHSVHRVDIMHEYFDKATLGPARDDELGYVTWRIRVPTDLVGVSCGVATTKKSPQSYVATAVSFDGERFVEYYRNARAGQPFEDLQIRDFGREEIPHGAREVFLRCSFETPDGAATYAMPGIQDVLIRVMHQPRSDRFRPVEIKYEWIEHRETGDVARSHTEIVQALPHEYVINTAGYRDPTMVSVRMRLVDAPVGERAPKSGYSDGEDVGDDFERVAVRYTWGRNLAAGQPYVASRSSSSSAGNTDSDGVELTNHKIMAPTELTNQAAVQAATAFWASGEPVEFVVDLGERQDVAGARVSSHQPNERYCHPETVHVDVSADGITWRNAGVIKHAAIWHPPIDFEPWEHNDDPDFAALPAGGRLAYTFPLVFEEQRSARFIRFVCAPFEGRGMGLSELEAFDAAAIAPAK